MEQTKYEVELAQNKRAFDEQRSRIRQIYAGQFVGFAFGRVIAAGGIRDAADVDAVRSLGLDGVVVGRAWLDGTLEL